MNRVAILISGQMRTAKQCYESIKKSLPTGDYFVHAALDEDCDDAEIFSPVEMLIESQPEMEEKEQYSRKKGRGCQSIQGVLKQLYSLKRTWEIFEKHHKKYNWVIRCRADLLFTNKVEPKTHWTGDIIIPKFSNFHGLNDRFAIISSSFAQKYFTRIDCLDEYIERGGIFHPESFLYDCFKEDIISRSNVTFNTLRKNGTQHKPTYESIYGDIYD